MCRTAKEMVRNIKSGAKWNRWWYQEHCETYGLAKNGSEVAVREFESPQFVYIKIIYPKQEIQWDSMHFQNLYECAETINTFYFTNCKKLLVYRYIASNFPPPWNNIHLPYDVERQSLIGLTQRSLYSQLSLNNLEWGRQGIQPLKIEK